MTHPSCTVPPSPSGLDSGGRDTVRGKTRAAPFLALLGVAGLTFAADGASAQTTEDAHSEMRRLFDEGVAALDREDYGTALVAFQRAYELEPRPVLLLNIGMCHRALSQFPEAVTALRRYLAAAGPDGPADLRGKAQDMIAEMELNLGQVRINVSLQGALLFVDGDEVGISPLVDPLPLGPGAHNVEARLDGYRDARQSFSLMAGESTTVDLVLEPNAPPPIVVSTEPPPPPPVVPDQPVTSVPVAVEEPTAAEDEDGGIVSSWWFWTVIGVVVAGGATTAAVLLWPGDEDSARWTINGR